MLLQEVMEAQNLGACVTWNYAAAGNGGVVPMQEVEEVAPTQEWGRMCSVGAIPGNAGKMRKMEKFL